MREERVSIPGNGITLEGLLSIHEALPFQGGVVVCHPHPQYGGDMDNPVVVTAVEAAAREGFSTLRFNFRGAGGSEGTYADGEGEKEDVRAALSYLSSRLKGDDSPIHLVGYSFGAWVGVPVAVEDERVKGIVAIAPPLEMYSFKSLISCKKPKLIIAGNRDFLCPAASLEDLYQQMEEPKSLRMIPGADHFFSSHFQSLVEPLREFLRKSPAIKPG
jgi:alpha/beta superfamily hydrolase